MKSRKSECSCYRAFLVQLGNANGCIVWANCAFAVREPFPKSMDLHQMLVAFTYQDRIIRNFGNTVSTAEIVLSESSAKGMGVSNVNPARTRMGGPGSWGRREIFSAIWN